MPLALLALAISAFAIGTTEFVTTGLLQDIARDLHITIPQAGYLTSGYALGVVISAPILTLLLARFNRKHTLVFLILLFIVGSLASAKAATFEQLMLGRVLSAFCHGAFFGIGAVVATTVVAPNKKASAIALMFTGLTLANVVGVPLGTYFGQHFGWRAAFWAIAVLGAIGFVGLAALVPKQLAERSPILDEIAVFKRPQVWLALIVTAVGFSGLLASFAYISPMMTEVAGFAPENLAWILSIYGVGLVIGNIVAAKFADRALAPTILTLLFLLNPDPGVVHLHPSHQTLSHYQRVFAWCHRFWHHPAAANVRDGNRQRCSHPGLCRQYFGVQSWGIRRCLVGWCSYRCGLRFRLA
ncbi:MFS transporter [Serratia plymuthica]|uniref:MFS transporter n=1 Tax=Serratia plymuthica TaxID=82996 RepID=UPI0020C85EC4|nr:MFS transporter [Serratia plymuthica]UTN96817.1 MFS transporter [Serratia plymuthica]